MGGALPDGGDRPLTRPAPAGEGRLLCRLDEIGDPGSRGFDRVPGAAPFFVVRRRNEVFAYRNRCPHAGAPLDWRPGAFLSAGRDMVLCSMHGALFEIGSGVCVRGPCRGDALSAVPVEVRGGGVYLPAAPGEACARDGPGR